MLQHALLTFKCLKKYIYTYIQHHLTTNRINKSGIYLLSTIYNFPLGSSSTLYNRMFNYSCGYEKFYHTQISLLTTYIFPAVSFNIPIHPPYILPLEYADSMPSIYMKNYRENLNNLDISNSHSVFSTTKLIFALTISVLNSSNTHWF